MGSWKRVPAYLAGIGLLLPSFVPAAAQQAAGSRLPDSPGAIYAKLQQTENRRSNLDTQTGPSISPKPQTVLPETQPQAQTSPPSTQKPVGAAAAEPPNVSGVAASQPAGMAIAPAKQRRARSLVLRVGAIAGVGVAVGTVYALSRSTSSKPPGSK